MNRTTLKTKVFEKTYFPKEQSARPCTNWFEWLKSLKQETKQHNLLIITLI